MNNRALLSAVTLASAAAVAVGCAMHSPKVEGGLARPTKTCDEMAVKCDVVVSVASCTPGGITLDHQVLGVRKGYRDLELRWTISTPGYDFSRKDGVKFKGDEWPKEFDLPDGNKNRYKWRDRNYLDSGKERRYDYSVTVVKSDGTPCATLDPTIVNDA
jgi:hypothetical protein